MGSFVLLGKSTLGYVEVKQYEGRAVLWRTWNATA